MYARVSLLLMFLCALFLTSCQEKLADRFEREAKEYTGKNCPQRCDDVTTLDSLVYDKDGVGQLNIYYSLTLSDEERDKVMNQLGELGDMNLKTVRNSVNYEMYRQAGVNFRYVYIDAVKGDKIVEYNFSKKDYER